MRHGVSVYEQNLTEAELKRQRKEFGDTSPKVGLVKLEFFPTHEEAVKYMFKVRKEGFDGNLLAPDNLK